MDNILTDIEAFCDAHGIAESRFGRLALGDANLVADLREGRELRRSTAAKVRRYMLTFGAQKQAA